MVKLNVLSSTPKGNAQETPSRLFNLALVCFMLVTITVAVYWQVIGFDFIVVDDLTYVQKNDAIKEGLTIKGIKWAFTSVYASNWHPLTWISHMIDIELFGLTPGMHHLTNLLLHVMNGILLFLVFEKMTGEIGKSAAVAALFALHPLHVESVAWIAERKDVLSTFFWMLTMMSYIWYGKQRNYQRYLMVGFFYILGLMSKPMLVTLPFVLILMDLWPLKRWGVLQKRSITSNNADGRIRSGFLWPDLKTLILEKAPLILLALLASSMTIYAQKGAMSSLDLMPLNNRLLNVINSYAAYLGKMIWPLDLAIFYPFHPFIPWWFIICALFLLLVSLSFLFVIKKYPYLAMGWFWYLATLIPVIGIVQVGGQSMADRYTYIPLIGIFIILVWGSADLLGRWQHGKIVLGVVSAVVFTFLVLATYRQIGYWKNSEPLFSHALAVTQNNYFVHGNFGIFLEKKGDLNGAIQHYKEALRINPQYKGVNINLGALLSRMGNVDEAVRHYEAALQIDPHSAEIYYNLGGAYYKEGKMKKAGECFERAIREKPDYPEAIQRLEFVQNRLRNLEEQILPFQDAIKQKPNNAELYVKLGDIYQKLENYDEAQAHYQKAISIQPKFMQAYYGIVLSYSTQKEYGKALDTLKNMEQIQPSNPDISYNIACIYAKQDMKDEAIAWLGKAVEKGFNNWSLIKKDPDLTNIRNTAYMKNLMVHHRKAYSDH